LRAADGVEAKACWASEALAGKPNEKAITRGERHFDKAPPGGDLAAYSPIPAGLGGAIRRVTLPKGRNLIALTFDLCEQPGEIAGYDGEIVDYLRQNAIRATFFAGGKWMRSHGERARQLISDPLFEVGNHSEAHRNLRLLKGAALADEIEAPQRAYEVARGELTAARCVREAKSVFASAPPRMSLFRFPYGACNADAMAAVNGHGLLAIQWDVSTGDPSPAQTAHAIADAMVRGAKPGSIIIAHANGRGYHTAEALPLAIAKLRAKGFEFVTVSELLAAGTPEIASSCYDSRPGDTDKYDRLQLSRRLSPEP
jgi:peptidoglycan/xylan/chitin deacetylase (PgdA/CDA1 family)